MRKRIIQSNPAIMMGKPVIAGTRITVELILEKLAAGESVEQILEAHPRLRREDIRAALAFKPAQIFARCGRKQLKCPPVLVRISVVIQDSNRQGGHFR